MRRVELVDDLPIGDLLVGAVGRQDGAVELVEERRAQVDALAVRALVAHVHDHVLRGVDLLERVRHHIGLVPAVVGDLGGLVDHRIAIGDLGDGHRQHHLIALPQQCLVDVRILQRIQLAFGILLEILGLRVALEGLARRRDLRVHRTREHIGHTIGELDVEPVGHVLARLVENLDTMLIRGQVPVVVIIDDARTLHTIRQIALVDVL